MSTTRGPGHPPRASRAHGYPPQVSDTQTAARRGRPPTLSREAIVAAAIEGGVSDLTMKGLAARLGVGPSALYRWVGDLEEVLDLVVVDVIDRLIPPLAPRGGAWREWLADLGWAMHDAFTAIPGFAERAASPHRPPPEAHERLADAMTSALRAGGVSEDDAQASWRVFALAVVSWLGMTARPRPFGDEEPGFDVFLGVLIRGLPVSAAAHPPA